MSVVMTTGNVEWKKQKKDAVDCLISWGEWGKQGLLMLGKDLGLLVSVLLCMVKAWGMKF